VVVGATGKVAPTIFDIRLTGIAGVCFASAADDIASKSIIKPFGRRVDSTFDAADEDIRGAGAGAGVDGAISGCVCMATNK
jgi:hypothetical protein